MDKRVEGDGTWIRNRRGRKVCKGGEGEGK